ncbi:Gfo/Idh/MocA family oxidoreductase [Rhizobium sp. CFBP 8762]|uniref:Gfo/Idh/MocA family oxidoreductase n=1 Tax=Rhizobium sp. CFBP 8762 TaxID=2775279 RepID=UPI00177BACC9|nr:Gfo/Idh/MocA family oxidoreductase [Rhizobium sp. CFBP 8762]MBD8554418.1 Gfo/Idh/MocA family oxidoreductase [Rhizobium sp. CFBP 8762]
MTEALASSAPPVRIGIVGLGRLGSRHAENLSDRVAGARLVAAASPVEQERATAQRAFPGIAVYEDLPGLLAHEGLDAVWLVTPTSLHADQIITVLEAGKHVFCEKPLALEIGDCDRVIAVADRFPDQVAMVGFMRRFDPAYAEAKRRIDAGALGDVFAIACRSEDPVDPNGFFVRFAPTSGGIFLDCCIHDVDLVRWMLDGASATHVSSAGSRVMYPDLAACNDVDTAFATVNFDGGKVATFHVSRTSHRGYEATMTIIGTKGTLEIGRGLSKLPLVLDSDGARHVHGQTDFFDRFNDAFLAEARAFVSAIQTGQPSPLGLHDARQATALAARMRDALVVG